MLVIKSSRIHTSVHTYMKLETNVDHHIYIAHFYYFISVPHTYIFTFIYTFYFPLTRKPIYNILKAINQLKHDSSIQFKSLQPRVQLNQPISYPFQKRSSHTLYTLQSQSPHLITLASRLYLKPAPAGYEKTNLRTRANHATHTHAYTHTHKDWESSFSRVLILINESSFSVRALHPRGIPARRKKTRRTNERTHLGVYSERTSARDT